MYNDSMDNNNLTPADDNQNQPLTSTPQPADVEAAKKYQEILDKYAADLAANTMQDSPSNSVPAEAPAASIIDSQSSDTTEFDTPVSVQLQEVAITPSADPTPLEEVPVVPPSNPLPPVSDLPHEIPPAIVAAQAPIENITLPVMPPLPPSNSATSSVASSSPSQPSLFKYLFYLSFIVFLCVAAGLGWTMYKLNGLKGTKSTSLIPTITSVTSSTPTSALVATAGCDLNENHYAVGQNFPAADGCNTCTCGVNLTIDCTQKDCSATVTPTAKTIAATASAISADWKKVTLSKILSFAYPKTFIADKSKSDSTSLALVAPDKSKIYINYSGAPGQGVTVDCDVTGTTPSQSTPVSVSITGLTDPKQVLNTCQGIINDNYYVISGSGKGGSLLTLIYEFSGKNKAEADKFIASFLATITITK